MPTNSDAHAFAASAHAEQVDRAGKPYIRHLNRVAGSAAERVRHAIERDALHLVADDVIQAAYLHDVLEDTATTPEDLRRAGFSEPIIEMIVLLTKVDDGSSYAERIQRLAASGNLGALLVKLSDNEDNRRPDPGRPAGVPVSPRYLAALPILQKAAAALGYTGR